MSAILTLGSLGAVSLTAGAQESIGTVTKITSGDFVYTVEDNVATIVDYTGSANALVIPQDDRRPQNRTHWRLCFI